MLEAVNDRRRRRRSRCVSTVCEKVTPKGGGGSFKTGLLSSVVNKRKSFKGVGELSCMWAGGGRRFDVME
ncbi:hypothetical protein JTE90_010118 [Oedothorax gibbosus]|uniref:Uncharacterized protein n=1 Tax=Oedothorax gibbosus TaxID=931172 RepID=A0AAV6UD00_9ARAC|nr:hypothetical protein JTE90_010118 [Oedothorax gibbosus]